jgi:hypothetical protein
MQNRSDEEDNINIAFIVIQMRNRREELLVALNSTREDNHGGRNMWQILNTFVIHKCEPSCIIL